MRRFAVRALDLLLPPQCLCCDALVDRPGMLCAACWPQLRFIDRPQCARCGIPFEVDPGDGAICGACAASPPAFGRARAALIYDDGSRPLTLAFKHGDRTDAAPALGRWMARAGRDVLESADLLAPVPLHWTRLFGRRYNQAALLAQSVGRAAGLPVVPDLLVRRRRTPSLGRLGRSARRRLVGGAFAVHAGHASRIRDARIVLVDDVHTTGATVEACTRVLLRGGAAQVDVLTLARTHRPATS
ncbi:MAG: ComF family protein [Rhodospirillales bacterium]|nr:MAG: ComF family protein [Rhodospirillales bacterium]